MYLSGCGCGAFNAWSVWKTVGMAVSRLMLSAIAKQTNPAAQSPAQQKTNKYEWRNLTVLKSITLWRNPFTKLTSHGRTHPAGRFPDKAAGDAWRPHPPPPPPPPPPFWNFRAVVWFHFLISFFVLLSSPFSADDPYSTLFTQCRYWLITSTVQKCEIVYRRQT